MCINNLYICIGGVSRFRLVGGAKGDTIQNYTKSSRRGVLYLQYYHEVRFVRVFFFLPFSRVVLTTHFFFFFYRKQFVSGRRYVFIIYGVLRDENVGQ